MCLCMCVSFLKLPSIHAVVQHTGALGMSRVRDESGPKCLSYVLVVPNTSLASRSTS